MHPVPEPTKWPRIATAFEAASPPRGGFRVLLVEQPPRSQELRPFGPRADHQHEAARGASNASTNVRARVVLHEAVANNTVQRMLFAPHLRDDVPHKRAPNGYGRPEKAVLQEGAFYRQGECPLPAPALCKRRLYEDGARLGRHTFDFAKWARNRRTSHS